MQRRPRTRGLGRALRRIGRFVRALFGGSSAPDGRGDAEGGIGVREPRRPLTPSLTGATALERPTDDDGDLR